MVNDDHDHDTVVTVGLKGGMRGGAMDSGTGATRNVTFVMCNIRWCTGTTSIGIRDPSGSLLLEDPLSLSDMKASIHFPQSAARYPSSPLRLIPGGMRGQGAHCRTSAAHGRTSAESGEPNTANRRSLLLLSASALLVIHAPTAIATNDKDSQVCTFIHSAGGPEYQWHCPQPTVQAPLIN